MLRRIGIGLLWALGGYFVGAVVGGLLVNALSRNRFDREMETVMTGAFVTGPVAAVVVFVVGAAGAGRKRASGETAAP